MCRLVAYAGPARSIASVMLEGTHSLEHQSYQPTMMEDALLNADGHGVAWYAEGLEGPARYRNTHPIWGDPNMSAMGEHIRSTHLVGYVRSATPGIGMGLLNTQPFVHGKFAFTHNGYLKNFRDGTMRRIRQSLGKTAYEAIAGTSDSEHLFGLFIDGLDKGLSPRAALDATLERAVKASEGEAALMAFAITDGESIWATTEAHHHERPPTLFIDRSGPGTRIASEPTDDADWHAVPPGERLQIVWPPQNG